MLQQPKACPFCGGPGIAHAHAEASDIKICGCEDPDCIGFHAAFDFDTEEHAIAAWNTRAPGPASKD